MNGLADSESFQRWWQEHSELDGLVREVEARMARGSLAKTSRALERLEAALDAHFTLEERVYFPLIDQLSPSRHTSIQAARTFKSVPSPMTTENVTNRTVKAPPKTGQKRSAFATFFGGALNVLPEKLGELGVADEPLEPGFKPHNGSTTCDPCWESREREPESDESIRRFASRFSPPLRPSCPTPPPLYLEFVEVARWPCAPAPVF